MPYHVDNNYRDGFMSKHASIQKVTSTISSLAAGALITKDVAGISYDLRHFLVQLQVVCTVRKGIFTEDILACSHLDGNPRNNFQSIDELQVVSTVCEGIFTEDFLIRSPLHGNPTDNFP
ncbi:MAG: hypothetical protein SFY80_09050 [Verrucomicrobiota bacterium]|nr:hypothetical protein [Verrucomicrobiota bacterium]